MIPLAERRLDRAVRKAVNAALEAGSPLAEPPIAEAALEAAERAFVMGNPYALGGIGRVDHRRLGGKV